MKQDTGLAVRWDAAAGAAGDMALGALLDAGAPLEFVRGQLDALGLDGWSLSVEPAKRAGLAGTFARVRVQPGPAHRHYGWIREHLATAPLAPGVRAWALRIFAVLAEAEAHVHRIDVERVHFHEVGALDAIVDVVGTAAALDALGVTRGYCSGVVTGFGTVSTAHGVLPVPAPAVTELLRRTGIPASPGEIAAERLTPTGMAIIAATCQADTAAAAARVFPPRMTVEAIGYGAGTADHPGHPNLLRAVVCRVAATPAVDLADLDSLRQPTRADDRAIQRRPQSVGRAGSV
ncbi:TIGR00299 family protein [Parafrankia irregularis]|uniref:TIGR00299 family protein n=1 Tax=Parafrankia irregularis TaxID=795642 RepID=A0A0S4QMI7_9ACTN|nr:MULTISPECIES: LarC family nickel insertion protein [Parafrankia]CUU56833.1 TIGR00299 family protein [Parafrankia irregularis]